jgi:hypothetical protein
MRMKKGYKGGATEKQKERAANLVEEYIGNMYYPQPEKVRKDLIEKSRDFIYNKYDPSKTYTDFDGSPIVGTNEVNILYEATIAKAQKLMKDKTPFDHDEGSSKSKTPPENDKGSPSPSPLGSKSKTPPENDEGSSKSKKKRKSVSAKLKERVARLVEEYIGNMYNAQPEEVKNDLIEKSRDFIYNKYDPSKTYTDFDGSPITATGDEDILYEATIAKAQKLMKDKTPFDHDEVSLKKKTKSKSKTKSKKTKKKIAVVDEI